MVDEKSLEAELEKIIEQIKGIRGSQNIANHISGLSPDVAWIVLNQIYRRNSNREAVAKVAGKIAIDDARFNTMKENLSSGMSISESINRGEMANFAAKKINNTDNSDDLKLNISGEHPRVSDQNQYSNHQDEGRVTFVDELGIRGNNDQEATLEDFERLWALQDTDENEIDIGEDRISYRRAFIDKMLDGANKVSSFGDRLERDIRETLKSTLSKAYKIAFRDKKDVNDSNKTRYNFLHSLRNNISRLNEAGRRNLESVLENRNEKPGKTTSRPQIPTVYRNGAIGITAAIALATGTVGISGKEYSGDSVERVVREIAIPEREEAVSREKNTEEAQVFKSSFEEEKAHKTAYETPILEADFEEDGKPSLNYEYVVALDGSGHIVKIGDINIDETSKGGAFNFFKQIFPGIDHEDFNREGGLADTFVDNYRDENRALEEEVGFGSNLVGNGVNDIFTSKQASRILDNIKDSALEQYNTEEPPRQYVEINGQSYTLNPKFARITEDEAIGSARRAVDLFTGQVFEGDAETRREAFMQVLYDGKVPEEEVDFTRIRPEQITDVVNKVKENYQQNYEVPQTLEEIAMGLRNDDFIVTSYVQSMPEEQRENLAKALYTSNKIADYNSDAFLSIANISRGTGVDLKYLAKKAGIVGFRSALKRGEIDENSYIARANRWEPQLEQRLI